MELGYVEAGHGVGVALNWQNRVPGTKVELLPGHLASNLPCVEVPGCGSRFHSDAGVAALLEDGLKKVGRLGIQNWGVDMVVGGGVGYFSN
ncbi:hypothetical protein ACFX13_005697 [Malus domestica]